MIISCWHLTFVSKINFMKKVSQYKHAWLIGVQVTFLCYARLSIYLSGIKLGIHLHDDTSVDLEKLLKGRVQLATDQDGPIKFYYFKTNTLGN